MTSSSWAPGTKTLPQNWKTHLNDAPRPFNLVSQNLQNLGALSIDRFLAGGQGADTLDISSHGHALPTFPEALPIPSALPPDVTPTPKSNKTDIDASLRMHKVAHLHKTCQRVFGSGKALQFDYVTEGGPMSLRCILTITRPNGSQRSYKTDPVFSRKTDARIEVASIAIDMGAIDFIVSGDSDALKAKKGLLLAPLDVGDSLDDNAMITDAPPLPREDNSAVQEIEDCCVEWRAGLVKAEWIALTDPKLHDKYGTALRIRLTAHSSRVYSSDTVYDDPLEAKAACAQVAHNQGVIQYIKRGNGQTQPTVIHPNKHPVNPSEDLYPMTPLSLQMFYESLPQPFPEALDGATAAEINAPAWLNMTVQSARGGRLKVNFVSLSERSSGFYGCLLRLDRPGDSKTYLVDNRFPKRADAKAAVCLLAISQGVGHYIRSIKAEAENKLPQESRKLANEILTLITAESNQIQPGLRPQFTFETDRDAFGASMVVTYSMSSAPPQTREYTVPVEYRTKADARAAVTCLAAEQGVIDLLRFRGELPPAGYIPYWEFRNSQEKTFKRKGLKADDDNDMTSHKRRKADTGGSSEPLNLGPRSSLPGRSFNPQHKGSKQDAWMRSHDPGFSGAVSSSVRAHVGRPGHPSRHANKSMGPLTNTHHGLPHVGHSPMALFPEVTPPRTHYPYAPVPHGGPSYETGPSISSQHAPYSLHGPPAQSSSFRAPPQYERWVGPTGTPVSQFPHSTFPHGHVYPGPMVYPVAPPSVAGAPLHYGEPDGRVGDNSPYTPPIRPPVIKNRALNAHKMKSQIRSSRFPSSAPTEHEPFEGRKIKVEASRSEVDDELESGEERE